MYLIREAAIDYIAHSTLDQLSGYLFSTIILNI